MNILQIISGRSVNGALVYCKILCEELVARGHNVTLLGRPNCWVHSNVDPTKVNLVESSLAKFPLAEFKRIGKLIRDQKIDLIHTHMTRSQNFGVGLKMMTGVPVIATAHNTHFQLHWNFNDFVIANSNSTYDFHAKINRVPANRMQTVYCCTDMERFCEPNPTDVVLVRSKLNLQPEDFLIAVVGELAIRKGQINLVKALPDIVRQVPNAKVVFVGRFGRKQPHVRQIRKFILENNLAGRVKWVGRQSNVAAYLAASQLTVVPSLEEPLGLVAIESLMSGTPVVASDTGGLREIIKHGETGLLVTVGDSPRLADAVITMARNPALRNTLADNGQCHVLETFSNGALIDQVEAVYNRVVTKTKAA